MRIRTVVTGSGKHAVQIVSKRDGKVTVHAHIGTYTTDAQKALLFQKARTYIDEHDSTQQSLFPESSSPSFSASFSDMAILQSQPLFLYHLLSRAYDHIGLNRYDDPLMKDLVIMRIYHPSSKHDTVDMLERTFGISYSIKTVYRHLKQAHANGMKETYQNALIEYVKTRMGDALRLVFYDVTTLYFESIIKDTLRDFGFSKENRSAQTQVVVGLVVNRDGFPLYFDVFTGNTFEGHTFVPLIEKIKAVLGNQDLVVVADAAMISKANMEALDAKHIGFVVGARLFQLPIALQNTLAKTLTKQDMQTTVAPYGPWRLVCQYSTKRAAKDKSDREKQIERATNAAAAPSRISRRYRFLQATGETYTLNQSLVDKAKNLEGMKGYMTNTDLDEQTIITRYHDLWRIEKAFRITKSDLEARPIFHHLKETITMHVTMVFASLAISKYLELATGWSIKTILTIAQSLLTHTVRNKQTGELGTIETTIEDTDLCGKLSTLRNLGH